MALIEGFRVRNYRALRDVTLGKLSTQQQGEPLTPFTVVIGKNGAGKSTLFDAFGFVADCLSTDVETACDDKQRGGFERMRSLHSAEDFDPRDAYPLIAKTAAEAGWADPLMDAYDNYEQAHAQR